MTEELLDECLKIREDRDKLKTALEWMEKEPDEYNVVIQLHSFNAIYLERNSIREKIKKVILEELAETEARFEQILNS